MDVEVNEENIDLFALVKMTGNSREEMLSRAAEARESGYILSVKIPDDQLYHNVFDNYVESIIEELPNKKCRYEEQWTIDSPLGVFLCVIHGEPSKHDVKLNSNAPCLRIDPERKDD